MQNFLFFAALLIGLALPAQVAIPQPLPDSSGTGANYGAERERAGFALEFAGGLNVVARRRPTASRFTAGRLSPRPGLFIGMNMVYGQAEGVGLLIGADYAWDRTRINDFSQESNTFRSRIGRVSVSEHFFRVKGQILLRAERFEMLTGLQLSSYLGGEQRNDYLHTITGFEDFDTGTTVFFDEPRTRAGSTVLDDSDFTGYLSLLTEVRYEVVKNWLVVVRYDLGLHLAVNLRSDVVNHDLRQRRHRGELGVVYVLGL